MQAEPVKTGAVARDVGKLNPGKLMKDQIAKKNTQQLKIVSTAGNKVKHANIMLDTLLYDIVLQETWTENITLPVDTKEGLLKGGNGENNNFDIDILNKKSGNVLEYNEGDNVDENDIIDKNSKREIGKFEEVGS